MTTQSTPQCVSSNYTWPQAARMARGVAHTNLETLKEGRRLPFPHHATPGNALTYQQYGAVYECSVLAALSIRREGDGGVALKAKGRRGSCARVLPLPHTIILPSSVGPPWLPGPTPSPACSPFSRESSPPAPPWTTG